MGYRLYQDDHKQDVKKNQQKVKHHEDEDVDPIE
jgi:hypothetical protein